jgi:hypothetical protein
MHIFEIRGAHRMLSRGMYKSLITEVYRMLRHLSNCGRKAGKRKGNNE